MTNKITFDSKNIKLNGSKVVITAAEYKKNRPFAKEVEDEVDAYRQQYIEAVVKYAEDNLDMLEEHETMTIRAPMQSRTKTSVTVKRQAETVIRVGHPEKKVIRGKTSVRVSTTVGPAVKTAMDDIQAKATAQWEAQEAAKKK